VAYPVIVPKEGSEMESCRIIHWYVQAGDRVETGQPLCEVDTGKAVFDIEAPAGGTILAVFYEEKEEAPLLAPIAVLGDEGEEFEHLRPDRPHSPSQNVQPVTELHINKKALAGDISKAQYRNKKPVSPRARLLARENNVPLNEVTGSGPNGAVVAEDVQRWIAEHGIH
jgi:pyruvate dehydrogenase E2 component (dihydrolipoamide acetyltransferase)